MSLNQLPRNVSQLTMSHVRKCKTGRKSIQGGFYELANMTKFLNVNLFKETSETTEARIVNF